MIDLQNFLSSRKKKNEIPEPIDTYDEYKEVYHYASITKKFNKEEKEAILSEINRRYCGLIFRLTKYPEIPDTESDTIHSWNVAYYSPLYSIEDSGPIPLIKRNYIPYFTGNIPTMEYWKLPLKDMKKYIWGIIDCITPFACRVSPFVGEYNYFDNLFPRYQNGETIDFVYYGNQIKKKSLSNGYCYIDSHDEIEYANVICAVFSNDLDDDYDNDNRIIIAN